MSTSLSVKPTSFWQSLSKFDWIYAVLLLAGGIFSYQRYAGFMDVYEVSFLFGAVAVFSYLGWRWSAIARLVLGVAVLSLIGVYSYQGDLANGSQRFLLKFLLASQSAVMWMNVLFVLAMLTYWLALFQKSAFTAKVASALTWAATLFGFVGLMVRWYESYLIAPDVGHIPISNLYEVFILFCLITA
ncbi:MAG TPA: c-type cytochrome biogenesis protein CcsB, partial [Methylophilus sp.]|nr:c-type cytochrome biogenesis protein CcsB [Methylophilus sp.]